MLPELHIPVGISTENCLSWSSDGEIAIAANEEVYLLLPRHHTTEPWTHVRIPVNAFTNREWPWQDQASFHDMAIGEEQAKVTVVAAAWSPPGLGKYGHSTLAVLTSNLLLSVWTAVSEIADPESWERVLVVNDAMLGPECARDGAEARRSGRVRGMVWAPICEMHVDRESSFSERRWGSFMMAVSDDDCGIHVMEIRSPFLGSLGLWEARSLCYMKPSINQRPIQRTSLLSLAMNERNYIDDVQFCKWDTTNAIVIMYSCRGIQYQGRLSVLFGPPLDAKFETDGGYKSVQPLSEILPASPFDVIPRFQAQIEKHKKKYNVEHSQGEDVVAKTWGTAYHKDIQVICITLHPSKMFEYTAPGEDSAIILFDNSTDIESAEEKFSWQIPPEIDETRAHCQILETIFHVTHSTDFPFVNLNIKIIFGVVYATMLMTDISMLQYIPDMLRWLRLIETTSGADLTLETNCLENSQLAPPTPNIVRKLAAQRARAISDSGWPGIPLLDSCPICLSNNEPEAIISFESLTEAYCPQNHPFTRCSLTFLPILEPDVSKRCLRCGREYVDENRHPEIAEDARNPYTTPCLASLLFDRCDMCPYCGGKYCD